MYKSDRDFRSALVLAGRTHMGMAEFIEINRRLACG